MQAFSSYITKIIDFFYEKLILRLFPSRQLLSRELFRYACCGGSNMILDWIIFFLIYHSLEIFCGDVVYFSLIPGLAITSHILAFGITFPITLLTGFWLNKYVTFTHSSLQGWNQLLRYILIVLLNILINYVGLKFFVDLCHFYPTPSKMLVTLITVFVSYFGQKYFSFRS